MRSPQSIRRFLRFLRQFPRSLRGKEGKMIGKELVEKPEMEEVKREFPGISKAELKRHVGMHIGILGGKIVASASSAEKVLREAKRKYPGEEIALRYVGSERLLIKCKCLE